jgi:hypothetical protein
MIAVVMPPCLSDPVQVVFCNTDNLEEASLRTEFLLLNLYPEKYVRVSLKKAQP